MILISGAVSGKIHIDGYFPETCLIARGEIRYSDGRDESDINAKVGQGDHRRCKVMSNREFLQAQTSNFCEAPLFPGPLTMLVDIDPTVFLSSIYIVCLYIADI